MTKFYIFSFLLHLSLVSNSFEENEKNDEIICPEIDENNFCYKVYREPKTWEAATLTCEEQNGTILYIKNATFKKFIKLMHVMEKYNLHTLWTKGSMEAKQKNNCPYIQHTTDIVTRYNFTCDHELEFLCSQKTHLPQKKIKDIHVCEKDWTMFKHFCYKFSRHKTYYNWYRAQSECLKINSTIVSITSIEEQNFLQTFTATLYTYANYIWIGGIRHPQHQIFEWADGKNFNYSNWRDFEPSNGNDEEDCVGFDITSHGKDSKWNDNKCTSKAGYVCKKRANKLRQTENTKCSPNYHKIELSSKCVRYKHIHKNMTWAGATTECARRQMHLAAIRSPQEYDILLKQIPNVGRAWVGLRYSTLDKSYHWNNGTKAKMMIWKQPKEDEIAYPISNTCGAATALDRILWIVNCGEYLHNAICQDMQHPITTTTTTSTTSPTTKPTTSTSDTSPPTRTATKRTTTLPVSFLKNMMKSEIVVEKGFSLTQTALISFFSILVIMALIIVFVFVLYPYIQRWRMQKRGLIKMRFDKDNQAILDEEYM